MFENKEEKEILDNIYNYIVDNKRNYTFKRDGIRSYIIADMLLKVVEVIIHGFDIDIILDDGVYIYEEKFQGMDYARKFQELVQNEFIESEQKIRKYKKNDKRQFYRIAKSLINKKL
jgi:hypothetical protein